MFGLTKKKLSPARAIQEVQAQDLSDGFKRKISELHLQIRGGSLSPEELRRAEWELERLKKKLETRIIRVSAESAELAMPAEAPKPLHP